MIAVDASALRVILQKEDEAPWFARMIAENDCLVGMPTRLEVLLLAQQSGSARHVEALEALFQWRNVETIALSTAHLAAARAGAAQMARAAGGSLLDRLQRLNEARSTAPRLAGPETVPGQLNLGPCWPMP